MMMDERKFRILQAIIDDYILTAVPVGSRTISKKYDMGLSSATIRNEMSDLEELGYLDQPHVSAGRIPSAKAYRLYVDQLLNTGRIPSDSDAAVKGHFLGRMHQMEDVIDHAAQVLSSLTSYTAVVLPPTGKMPKIRTIQLVPVSDTSALVVIVTDMGIVRDQVVQVASDLDSDALYAISKTLTERLQGLTLHEAVAQMPQLMQGMHENERLLQGLGKALGQQDEMTHPHVAVGGTSNMLAYPEYSDMEKARSFLSLMETRDRLADIISQKGEMAFTVRIGPETGVPEMADCSIVTATYSTGSGRQGTIGVIGPTRMRYSRVLSVMNTMGQQLSEMFGSQAPQKNEKLDQAKDRILREANEKAKEILQEAKDVADETIRDFNKAGAGTDIRELEKKRQKVRDKINEKNERLSLGANKKQPEKKTLDPKKLKKGDTVKIVSMGLKGTVSTLPDAKGALFVQCGIMRTQTNVRDLVLVDEATVTTPTLQRTGAGKIKMSKTLSVSTEINLLGKTVDEALPALDKYLDDAYLAHLPSVRVVHGKGTGALRSAVHNHLKRLKYVKEFRLGEYGEGDAGVTIVTFK